LNGYHLPKTISSLNFGYRVKKHKLLIIFWYCKLVLLWWLHNKYDASTSELIRFNNFCQTHTNTCNYGSLSSSAVNCFWRVPQCQPHFPHFPSPFGAANICHATPCESKMPSGNRKCQMPFYSEARKLWKIAVGANWFSMLFDLRTPRVK